MAVICYLLSWPKLFQSENDEPEVVYIFAMDDTKFVTPHRAHRGTATRVEAEHNQNRLSPIKTVAARFKNVDVSATTCVQDDIRLRKSATSGTTVVMNAPKKILKRTSLMDLANTPNNNVRDSWRNKRTRSMRERIHGWWW